MRKNGHARGIRDTAWHYKIQDHKPHGPDGVVERGRGDTHTLAIEVPVTTQTRRRVWVLKERRRLRDQCAESLELARSHEKDQ